MANSNDRSIKDFEKFAKSAVKVPSRSGKQYRSGSSNYHYCYYSSKEGIEDILKAGTPLQIRELSEYFCTISGEYQRTLQYYSTLLDYSYIIVPHYDVYSKPKKMKAKYSKAAHYIKNLNLGYILPKINYSILSKGIYYGIFIDNGEDGLSLYELPYRFCRTRYLDENGLPILELDISYFNQITDSEIERKQLLKIFPAYVGRAYNDKKHAIQWVEIPLSEGGICFHFTPNGTPPFSSSLSSIFELEEARKRESKRDSKELEKILIHKLPVNKNDGSLFFSLPEAEVLHRSICDMLEEDDTIDVLTTYGDITLENAQDTDSGTASSQSRLSKYIEGVYDDMGTSSSLFNAESTATAMNYSVRKDISIMFAWSRQYEIAINYILKKKFNSNSYYFSIKFLPTSPLFRKENIDFYLKMAQYGYPRACVAAVGGLDNIDLLQVCDFENNVLHLENVMIPLSSSYTSSSEEKISRTGKILKKGTSPKDLTDEGGRPEKTVTERADRTNGNIDGAV